MVNRCDHLIEPERVVKFEMVFIVTGQFALDFFHLIEFSREISKITGHILHVRGTWVDFWR